MQSTQSITNEFSEGKQSEGLHFRQTQRNPINSARVSAFIVVAIFVVIAGWAIASRHSSSSAFSATRFNEDDIDRRLQRAATNALGDRRGAVIIIDPQTGRVRAVVNSKLAFEENLPPGSTIKPFTTLAALRSGVMDEQSRTLCHEKYSHEEFHTVCSHPRDLPPFNPTEALAYSCNYYFGKVGERLTEPAFVSTLSEFGFGKKTGVNAEAEAQGKVPRNGWHSQNAIGESDDLQATPIQIIIAYSALVNGGHLFTPRIGLAAGFVPELQTNLTIKDQYRSLIIQGMRGAVRYGTAESANLYSLPVYIFGKTGTATQINGFRSQGWFVGFASALDDGAKEDSALAPEKVKLAVIVFLTKAHGSEAAQVARAIFEEYTRNQTHDTENTSPADLKKTFGPVPVASPAYRIAPSTVRVHLVSENITRTMPLEDYVRGVVAVEGSLEVEPEALKALAIASRTYALKNLGRHAQDGYDFCTTTHCQRYRFVDSVSAISPDVIEAVDSTKGEVLRDAGNQIAESYFSASCGGATANVTTLWGSHAPPYLKGVQDEFCAGEAHHNWTDVISQTHLLKALQSDPRTNVGERLNSVRVSMRDASGRAQLIAIEGNRRLTVKGWDFKIIVGRALGWNLLKSSRFEIARSGSNFVFRGSGFGHGLGLCQEGAHVMAKRGANYRQILAKYFPGTEVTTEMETGSLHGRERVGRSDHGSEDSDAAVAEYGSKPLAFADLLWNKAELFETLRVTTNATININHSKSVRAIRRTLSSEDFRISYPATVNQREIEALLSLLQSSRKFLATQIAAAGMSPPFPYLEIFINETTGDFVGRTGQPAWAAAATKGNRIELQPLATLKRRRILETTLRHELVHTLVDVLGRGHTPRWLAEGLALHLAGEGRLVAPYSPRRQITTEEIEKQLIQAKSANDMRAAYAAAYREVRRLINTEGEANVWRRVAR